MTEIAPSLTERRSPLTNRLVSPIGVFVILADTLVTPVSGKRNRCATFGQNKQ